VAPKIVRISSRFVDLQYDPFWMKNDALEESWD
jgi:hypothetical protein